MTPTEATTRIIKSRQTLSRYGQMMAAGVDPAPGTTKLITAEIDILQGIAEGYPAKAHTLERLVQDWRALRDRIKSKMH